MRGSLKIPHQICCIGCKDKFQTSNCDLEISLTQKEICINQGVYSLSQLRDHYADMCFCQENAL